MLKPNFFRRILISLQKCWSLTSNLSLKPSWPCLQQRTRTTNSVILNSKRTKFKCKVITPLYLDSRKALASLNNQRIWKPNWIKQITARLRRHTNCKVDDNIQRTLAQTSTEGKRGNKLSFKHTQIALPLVKWNLRCWVSRKNKT